MNTNMGKEFLDMMLQPYAEEDELLNTWIERLLVNVRWKLFEGQEKWLYMSGELGEGAIPKFKNNAREYMKDIIYGEFGWLVDYLIERLIAEYRLSNIELDDGTIADLKWDMSAEEYEEWELECKRRIFEDYKEILGEEKTIEHFNKLWGENWNKE